MRLGAAQMFITNNVATNTSTILRMAEEARLKGVDLLVFPEMCLTGYDKKTLGRSDIEEELARALERIGSQVEKLKTGLIIGRAEFKDGKMYNAASVILPDGIRHTYYKIHLTAAEEKFFTPGTQPLSFTYKGKRFGVIICRDQNYPELARSSCPEGTSALFILSAHYYNPAEARWKLPKNRALPIARAVENHCYVLLANAVGSHIGLISLGNSLIADPEGALVALADEASETLITCDIPGEHPSAAPGDERAV